MSLGSTLAFPTKARQACAQRAEYTRVQRLTLELLCDGLTVREIAKRRNVSISSVHEALEWALNRSGARTRWQLIAWFARSYMVERKTA